MGRILRRGNRWEANRDSCHGASLELRWNFTDSFPFALPLPPVEKRSYQRTLPSQITPDRYLAIRIIPGDPIAITGLAP